jgi:hypothetical protein
VVHIVRLTSPEIAPNESAIADPQLCSMDELTSEKSRLETWSQICLTHLSEILSV